MHFFATASEALVAGFRPCKKCSPLTSLGSAPAEIQDLISSVLAEPSKKWKDYDLRERNLSPERVRRWFQTNHGMTFHAYARAVRVGFALGKMQLGVSPTRTAFESGFESVSGFNDAFKSITGMSPKESAGTDVIHIKRITSPLGILLIGASSSSIVLLEFGDRLKLATQLKTLATRFQVPVVPGTNEVIEKMEQELSEYFAQQRTTFTVSLDYPGTDFQQETWNALLNIPYGETRSYQNIADDLKRSGAVRAVANANGCNRIAIVIPCHRVIGSDGTLTGYGGGLWRKQRLLELEGAVAPAPPGLFD